MTSHHQPFTKGSTEAEFDPKFIFTALESCVIGDEMNLPLNPDKMKTQENMHGTRK